MKTPDISGRRYGRLVALSFAGYDTLRKAVWLCKCDCGLEVLIRANNLNSGGAKSCGHEGRASARKRAVERNNKHGMCGTPEYSSWTSMIRRCKYACVNQYGLYGGRGIRVCERWTKFENFLADMGRKPSPEYTIERIEVNGDYTPDNCCWATNLEQQRNRRNNRYVMLQGQRMALSQACEVAGTAYELARDRLNDGWTLDDALFKPKRAWGRGRPRSAARTI